MSKEKLIKLCSSLSHEQAKQFLCNFKILSLKMNFIAEDFLQVSKFGTLLLIDKLHDVHINLMLTWFK